MKKTINVDLAGAERTFRAQVHIKPSSAEHTGPLYHELSGLQGVANAWLEFYVRVADNENCGSFGTRRTLLEVSDGQNMLADQTMQIEGTIACENGMTAGAIEVQGFLNAEANLGGFVVDKGVARVDIALLVESIEIL